MPGPAAAPESVEAEPVRCVDCDRVIVGPAELLMIGDSMSGTRADIHAHPAGSSECEPKGHAKLALRRELGPRKPRSGAR